MLIELSYILDEMMPKWPTNPSEKYTFELSTRRGDPNNASSVFHHIHNGTHVDAPSHFDPKGRTIDQLPIEDFYFIRPLVLELPKRRGENVTLTDIEAHRAEIMACDILLIYTGYSSLRETSPEAFVNGFPSVSPAAARCLRVDFPGLKAVALDSISFDDAATAVEEGFPSHHSLLDTSEALPGRTLLLFEDVNIGRLLGVKDIKAICAFPVRWKGLEGAPVSMVANGVSALIRKRGQALVRAEFLCVQKVDLSGLQRLPDKIRVDGHEIAHAQAIICPIRQAGCASAITREDC